MDEILGKGPAGQVEDEPKQIENVNSAQKDADETVDDEEYARNRAKILEFNKKEQEGADAADIARMM